MWTSEAVYSRTWALFKTGNEDLKLTFNYMIRIRKKQAKFGIVAKKDLTS